MLQRLHLENTGPAPEMAMDPAPRINVVTGDNGLGKSFLLDVAWRALTGVWPEELNPALQSGRVARPHRADAASRISFFWRGNSPRDATIEFNRRKQRWEGSYLRDGGAIVVYVLVDGSFAVWDPARNGGLFPSAFVFSPPEVWNGMRDREQRQLCNGLISDWASWQRERGAAFEALTSVLAGLSAGPNERLVPGELTRVSVYDSRDIPTLRTPAGDEVPITLASAGVRRVLSLAYLLVWSWEEHRKASQLTGAERASRIVLLMDEVEAHLHPKWQRRIMKALLDAMRSLSSSVEVQLIATTHSPLVLASLEPFFDADRDAWFDLDLVDKIPALRKREFERLGDAAAWLTSPAFDLESSRSLEAERALTRANEALTPPIDKEKLRAIDAELRGLLGESDPFWIAWRHQGEKQGWLKAQESRRL